MKEKIIKLLTDLKFNNRTINELATYLNQDTTEGFKEVIKTMNLLEDEGEVIRDNQNRYYLTNQKPTAVGTISINKNGYGFVNVGEDKEDIYVHSKNLKDAFHNDTVLIELIPSSKGSHEEGKVIDIIERGQSIIVGEVKKGKRDLYVQADNAKFDKKIFVDSAHLHGAMPGHKVVVEIKVYKPLLKGNITKIIGHKSDPGVDILSIVNEHEAPVEFPKEVYAQIDSIPSEVDPKELEGRLDLRKETIVTIDGDDAKDLDDAISLKKLDNGNYYLGVHIADVSNYVTEGSALDKEAVDRGTSIYLVDRVIPMLPHKLSNGICSLNPQVDRLTISCFMEITPSGEVINHDLQPTVIHSTERMTYHNVNQILEGNTIVTEDYKHVKDLFFLMKELSDIIRTKRETRGAIDFDVKEAKVLVDEKGKPTDIVLRERGEGERIIEDFMLTANETVAMHFKWLDVPFIYRVHENPKEKKLQQFAKVAKTLGYSIKGSLENVFPGDLSAIIEASRGTEEQTIIATLLLRCMQKARYDEQCLGHFGLADDFYTHFTSPIRRYPDLLVHRLIRKYVFEKKMDDETIRHYQEIIPVLAEKTSNYERRAITIEREVDDMKMAEYMERHVGEEFDGIINSMTNFGFFVELENTVDGLIHITDLTDDFYFFDEINLQYIGQRTGRRFKMSDRVRVRVKAASKADKTIDFEIVGIKSNKKTSKTVIIKEHKGRNSKRRSRHDNVKKNDRGYRSRKRRTKK
ncbi:MAG: ribonuclease R [Coprobacillaceae bacterium]